MSRKIPNLELLGLDTFDRGAVNALGRTFLTHKLPEIFDVKIRDVDEDIVEYGDEDDPAILCTDQYTIYDGIDEYDEIIRL